MADVGSQTRLSVEKSRGKHGAGCGQQRGKCYHQWPQCLGMNRILFYNIRNIGNIFTSINKGLIEDDGATQSYNSSLYSGHLPVPGFAIVR